MNKNKKKQCFYFVPPHLFDDSSRLVLIHRFFVVYRALSVDWIWGGVGPKVVLKNIQILSVGREKNTLYFEVFNCMVLLH